jgi:DNA polymerase
MSRDPARQAQYLQALGVDRWVARRPGPAAANVLAAENVPAAASAPTADASAWDQIAAEVSGCVLCGLHKTRTQTVFGVGNRNAELLVVGEAPGADEDRQGEPFVGRAGQLLNSMLRAAGTPRETVFIANLLKCRPPGNRDPAPDEISSCHPYLRRQIELLAPRLILAVGRIAAQNLLATDTPIGKLRGSVHRYGAANTPLIVTYHPAYLLRSPTEKRKSWNDLQRVRTELKRLRTQRQGS